MRECVRFQNEMFWSDATKWGILCEVTYGSNVSGACDELCGCCGSFRASFHNQVHILRLRSTLKILFGGLMWYFLNRTCNVLELENDSPPEWLFVFANLKLIKAAISAITVIIAF